MKEPFYKGVGEERVSNKGF
uniref:Uncharacterized protein n=1 Tax=Rhizophora mucronata TaxID=61149 RepID=A0A2P2J2D9_RHIMU